MLPFFAVGQVGAVVLPRASDDFRYEAFLFIAGAEGFKQGKVYGDPLGVPTVGYGYALATKTKLGNQESWALKATLDADLSALTITLTQTQRDILNNIVGALNAGDSQFAKNLSDSLGNGSDRIRAITENEGHTLFNLELDRATNAVLERFKLFLKPIPGQALFDELQNSKEMVALASMAYNVPTTIGEKLARALANGDRAEAWYEIRYNTNSADQSSGIRRGIANRRYKESDRFALYNQRPMGDEDAKGAYRTFTRHKEGIKAYESTFSPPTDSSPIFTQLEGARLHLLAAYGQGVVFNWDNIWVGEDQTTAYYTSSDADVLTGSNQNDLMLGESGNDLLQGGGGEDVLHGNGGSDTLDGGEDSDWLYGGAGNDTFRYRPGSGSDHIFDSSTSPSGEGDGWGSILYDPDGMAQAVNTGLRKADDAENTWQSPDKTISFSLSGDVTITLPNGSIVVEQFNKDSKDLGIQLLTLPTDPENLESSPQWEATASGGVIQRNGTDQDDRQGTSGYKDFNGDSVNDLGEVRGLDNTVVQGGQGDDDIFGQGRLYGDDIADNLTGSDKIIGSGYLNGGLGGDVLLGKQERDHLVGGPPDNDNDGDDALQGDDGDDYLEGGNGRDVLAGGTGQDVLLGNKGDDHLVGDGTYTAQGRNWSATPISYMYDNTQLVGNIYIIPTEHFEGFSGEASVPGGQGDVMYGGLGKDSIRAGQGNDILAGEEDGDILYGGRGDDTLTGGAERDYVNGGAGSDKLFGGPGNDVLFDDAFDDSPSEHGDDYMDGGGGRDELAGHGGSDVILGGEENDKMWGGLGSDTLYGEGGSDHMQGGDGLSASDGDDQLFGGEGDDILLGEAGNDYLNGGLGIDELNGHAGRDVLEGGPGDDFLFWSRKEDRIIFRLGDGNDVASLESTALLTAPGSTGGNIDASDISLGMLTVSQGITNRGEQTLVLTFSPDDSLILVTGFFDEGQQYSFNEEVLNHRQLMTYAPAVTIFGSDGDDVVYGSNQADNVTTGIGLDTLQGQGGVDYLEGGAGNDTYIFNLGDGQDTISDYDFTPDNLDVLQLGGSIVLAGLRFEQVDLDLVVNISATDRVTVIGHFGEDRTSAIERILFADGSTFDLTTLLIPQPDTHFGEGRSLTGTDGADTLVGTEFTDSLTGLAGNDDLQGGEGNDIVNAGVFSLEDGQTDDDTLLGGPGNDTLTGAEGSDTYLFNRGDGQDVIEESDAIPGHADRIVLGDRIDPSIIVLSRSESDSGKITFTIVATGDQLSWREGAIERIEFKDGTVWDGAEIANRLNPSTGPGITIEGTIERDDLFGTSGDDTLRGGPSPDQIIAESGHDLVDGGTGDDYMAGESGRDTYVFNRGDGTDTVFDADPSLFSFGQGITPDDVRLGFIEVFDEGAHYERLFIEVLTPDPDTQEGIVYGKTAGDLDDLPPDAFDQERFRFFDGTELSYHELLARQGGVLPRVPWPPQGSPNEGAWVSADNAPIGTVYNDTFKVSGFTAWRLVIGRYGQDRFVINTAGWTQSGAKSILAGGSGDDTYYYNRAPGSRIHIYDTSQPGGINSLVLNSYRNQWRLRQGSLLLYMPEDDAEIHLHNLDSNNLLGSRAVGLFIFLDVTFTYEQLIAEGIEQQPQPSVNTPPVVAGPLADQLAATGTDFSFTIPDGAFSDADTGDSLVYLASQANGEPLPSWLRFDQASQTFVGRPAHEHVGTVDVRVTVLDRQGAYVSDTFTITVQSGNRPPVVNTPLADQTVTEYSPLSIFIPAGTVTDPDGDTLSFTTTLENGEPLPSWLRFDQATRHFYGLPTYTERGTLTIVLTATDTSGATVSDTFMVTVQPVTDTNLMAGDDQTNRLRGNRQNDLLVGMGGDDSLQGGGGGDVLDGGTGNDTLKAGSGGDTLYGGEGNDLLIGARGSDIYLFGYGDGQDIVQGADNSDTILLLVNPQDVVFVHEGNNLVIRLRDTADTLTLLNWYKGDRNRVAFIAVIDGQRLFPPD